MEDTVAHRAPAMALAEMPMTEDGTVDFRRLAVRLVEDCVNAAMEMAVEEVAGEGVRRNGYRERRLRTVIGEITLRIPRLREGSYFPEELLRPYSRTDRAMVAAIAEVYKMGMSTRKIERAAAELEFGRLSPSAISRMTQGLDADADSVREADVDGPTPYLWLDATYVSCRDRGRVEGRAVATAVAAMGDGSRRFVGMEFVDTESYDSWRGFLLGLRRRGASGVAMVVSDAHAGLRRAVREVFPGASWQRRVVHLERDAWRKPRSRADRALVAAAVSAAFAQRDPALVRAMYGLAVEEARAVDRRAGELLEDAREDALAYLAFPAEHRLRLRTNNIQERANREIKRRTDAVQVFPSPESLERLVGAQLAERNDEWAAGSFMDAAGMSDLGRDAEAGAALPDAATLERARALMDAAMREARARLK